MNFILPNGEGGFIEVEVEPITPLTDDAVLSENEGVFRWGETVFHGKIIRTLTEKEAQGLMSLNGLEKNNLKSRLK